MLIPKKDSLLSPREFQPISLLNSLYKVIKKILPTRLAKFLLLLIEDTQSAFIKGRSIIENFLSVHEMVAYFTRTRCRVLCKLDFGKAFDKVNWKFLDDVLRARGFPPKWVAWVEALISSSSIAVLLNGSPGKLVKCRQGLR